MVASIPARARTRTPRKKTVENLPQEFAWVNNFSLKIWEEAFQSRARLAALLEAQDNSAATALTLDPTNDKRLAILARAKEGVKLPEKFEGYRVVRF